MRKIYTYEECKEIASQCKTRKEVFKKNPTVFYKIYTEKWASTVFAHMKKREKPCFYTEELCKETIKKYKTLKDFREHERRMYAAISTHKWMYLLSDLKRVGGVEKRVIYAYEFPLFNSVYIGLTYNINVRNKDHHKRGTLFRWTQERNITDYSPKILKENIPFNMAGEIEASYMEKYRKDGWDLINIAKAGSLGGMILKNDDIVLFTEAGDYVDNGTVTTICEKYKLPVLLVKMCLRKTNKTTLGYQILSKTEWEARGKILKIENKTDLSRKMKVVILGLDFKLEKICDSKTEAIKYLGLKTFNCKLSNDKENIIVPFGLIPQKWVCLYKSYEKYQNGEYIIYNPHIPKDKKMVFLPKNCSEKEKNRIIENCFKRRTWEINRLEKKRNKKKCC